MNEILRRTLLFDFYGELLTAHQQEVYQEVVFDDVSFSELADREHVSRQSIHELVHKCDRALEAYETKMHLLERFEGIRENVKKIRQILAKPGDDPLADRDMIMEITDRILKEL